MIGSKLLLNALDTPNKSPSGVPINRPSEYPFATRTSEYQVKRKIP